MADASPPPGQGAGLAHLNIQVSSEDKDLRLRGRPNVFEAFYSRVDLRYFTAVFLGIPYGLSSQSILFRSINNLGFPWFTGFVKFTIVPQYFWWIITVLAGIVINLVFLVKLFRYPGAVHQEVIHPARVNFFFGPVLFFIHMALSHPDNLSNDALAFWYIVSYIYQLVFSIYLVGRWLFGKNRHLGQAKLPYLLSIVGFIANAGLGCRISPAYYHWSQFSFWCGITLFFLVTITLFQNFHKLSPEERNNPVVFLLVGPPGAAVAAYMSISAGEFTPVCEFFWCVATFLFLLVVRIASRFALSSKFGLTWWAYCFPMASYAQATQQFTIYKSNNVLMRTYSLFVSLLSMSILLIVAFRTLLEVWRGTLFVDPLIDAFVRGGGHVDEAPDTMPELRVLRNRYSTVAHKAVETFQALAHAAHVVGDTVSSSVKSLRAHLPKPKHEPSALALFQAEVLSRMDPAKRAHTIGAAPHPVQERSKDTMSLAELANAFDPP